ncbi:metal-dependent transcriptional regulator [Halorientalis marina]|jgi:DtxR family Mn-dependent transcriptional regulator|uniref:metal-dependent transcriptional regulator n=1 Tax=Halorientalis marina TaxID=2931976 RepID=UPI001FF0F86B|nr:metal-dependent transcriptional regulator [Halorientalis marina]
MLSDVMEDYLKAIYELQRGHGAPVGTSKVAGYLDVTSPTVTSMMEKLADRGLIVREKYKGVELTDEGQTVAIEIIRHHRLLEAFLVDHLDYEWTDVHAEADVLEHHISEEFEARIAERMGDPRVDPHGDPIPGETLEPPAEDDTAPLSAFEVGDRVVVARVRDRDEDELTYLSDAGIVPGRTLELVEKAPIGMVTVVHEDGRQGLPEGVAETIRARPVDGGADDEPRTEHEDDAGRPAEVSGRE